MREMWTPDMIAERWLCSSQTVRDLCHSGALRSFRTGRMFRIRREWLEDYEQCQTSASEDSAEVSASTGETLRAGADAISFRHAPERKQKARP